MLAALLFGYADTFRIMFESKIPIPSQFVQMLPYVLAIVVLVAVRGKSRAPAADGIPYEKGERRGSYFSSQSLRSSWRTCSSTSV